MTEKEKAIEDETIELPIEPAEKKKPHRGRIVALLVVVALAVGLVTHPIRTLALVFHKLAALAAGLALMLALIAWFWTDHSKSDFVPCFWGSIGVIVASILIRMLAEWILERPTRAERRAMKRAAAPTFDSRM